MGPRHLLAVLLAVIAVTAFVGLGAGSSHYDITPDPAVDTPPVERTIKGNTATVTEIGRIDPGETISVIADVPSGEDYTVYLYDQDGNVLHSVDRTGDGTVSFDAGDLGGSGLVLEPGTYAASLEHSQGVFGDAAPVVVSGYHATVDAPGSATQGDSVTVTADVTVVNDTKPIDRVQVIIGDGDDNRRVTLSGPGGAGTYEETFTLDQLPAGDYTLYVGVQGEQEVQGRQELLGVSDSQDFEIESSTTTSSTTTTTTTTTTTAAGGALPGGGGAAPGGGGDGTATADGDATTDGGTDDGPAGDGATTDDGVITPNPSPTTAPATTETAGQPLGLLPPLLALLLVALLVRRRR